MFLQILPGLDQQSWIGWIAWIFILSIFFALWNRLQVLFMLSRIERELRKIDLIRKKSIEISIESIRKNEPKTDPVAFVNGFIERVFIPPTDLDPSGIVWKLDHLLDVRRSRYREDIRRVISKASEAELSNLEGLLDASTALNFIYKLLKHFYILGKRTKSIYLIIQVYMALHAIEETVEALSGAVFAFSNGCPIGDGAGALVAAKLMRGLKPNDLGNDMIYSECTIDGRRVIILKSKGPGGNVGKPGDAIETIIKKCGGEIAQIIMIDAASKFEGEETGTVVEGIGAAIGGLGTEKFKIEEISSKYKIPLNAILIKQSLKEAISPLTREILKGVDESVERVKELIRKIEPKKTVIIAGIGNTIGIGQ